MPFFCAPPLPDAAAEKNRLCGIGFGESLQKEVCTELLATKRPIPRHRPNRGPLRDRFLRKPPERSLYRTACDKTLHSAASSESRPLRGSVNSSMENIPPMAILPAAQGLRCGGLRSRESAWKGCSDKFRQPVKTAFEIVRRVSNKKRVSDHLGHLCTCRPCKPGSVPGPEPGPLSFI